jgi:hypothetical protein
LAQLFGFNAPVSIKNAANLASTCDQALASTSLDHFEGKQVEKENEKIEANLMEKCGEEESMDDRGNDNGNNNGNGNDNGNGNGKDNGNGNGKDNGNGKAPAAAETATTMRGGERRRAETGEGGSPLTAFRRELLLLQQQQPAQQPAHFLQSLGRPTAAILDGINLG